MKCVTVGGAIAALICCGNVAFSQTTSVRPVFGGIPGGPGFSLGAEVSRPRLWNSVGGRLKVVASVRKYELLEAGIEVPHLGYWLRLEVTGQYRNQPQDDFWGLGSDSPKSARSNYLFESVDTTAVLGTVVGKFRTGITGGVTRINTGPGRDDRVPSVPEALQSSPRYTHAGLYFEYKSLDNVSDPSIGGRYAFRADTFGTKFQRYTLEATWFFPITRREWLAFRIQTSLTGQSSSEEIPFFMLPPVGGGDTVRGFARSRFRDRNAIVLNAEYRRPVTLFLDLVVFMDAGRVFSHAGDLGLRDLHASGGAGARFKLGSRVFFGVDVGASREGVPVWFRGGHIF